MPTRVAVAVAVVILSNTALLALLWQQTFASAAFPGSPQSIVAWATAAALASTVVDFVLFLWLHHSLTVAQRARDSSREIADRLLQANQLAQVQALSRRLMVADENARRRLGRDLHDAVGSNLSSVMLSFQLIRQEMGDAATPSVAARFEVCDQLLRQTVGQVRTALADLRPPALDELGLMVALRHLGRTMQAAGTMKFDIQGSEPSPRMAPDREIAFYRIAQEAFTNAAKHSLGSQVEARLSQACDGVTLRIADNGQGFDVTAPLRDRASLGMVGMRERAHAVDASLDIESSPRSGCAITVRASAPQRSAA